MRVTTNSKTNRESVLNLADNIMDRGLTQSLPYQLTPIEHRVEEVEMTSPVKITSSFQLSPFFYLPTEDPLDRGYDRTSKSSTSAIPHHTSSIPAPPSKRTSIPHKKTPFSLSTNSTQPSTVQKLGETDGSGSGLMDLD